MHAAKQPVTEDPHAIYGLLPLFNKKSSTPAMVKKRGMKYYECTETSNYISIYYLALNCHETGNSRLYIAAIPSYIAAIQGH